MKHIRRTSSALFGAGLLVLAACGSDSNSSAATTAAPTAAPTTQAPAETTPAPAETTMDTMAMMPLPDFAAAMKLQLTSDAADATVTDNVVSFNVAATGYELSCNWAGKAVTEGFGHYHVLLDKALVDMECTPEASISMQNVKPGVHTIAVVPAINDHAEVMENEVEFSFTYAPTSPLPEIGDAASTGTPSIKIISPKPGDVVKGDFDVVVEVTNYDLNCDLYGKPGLFGIGHYHVNLDSTSGPMMGMGTMLGMGCTTTFKASTEGLATGETHTVIALLADNGHAPLMPAIEGSVEVTVG